MASPEDELRMGAAVRDLVAGAALLGLGLLTGGSALDGGADALDYAFDALAALWIGWGLFRLARITSAGRRAA